MVILCISFELIICIYAHVIRAYSITAIVNTICNHLPHVFCYTGSEHIYINVWRNNVDVFEVSELTTELTDDQFIGVPINITIIQNVCASSWWG